MDEHWRKYFLLKILNWNFFSSPPLVQCVLCLYSRAARVISQNKPVRPKNSNLDIEDRRGHCRVLLLFVQLFGVAFKLFFIQMCYLSVWGNTYDSEFIPRACKVRTFGVTQMHDSDAFRISVSKFWNGHNVRNSGIHYKRQTVVYGSSWHAPLFLSSHINKRKIFISRAIGHATAQRPPSHFTHCLLLSV